jgi:cyclophilin family peptidyl-prolyl cis-trans isomerase/HEAT repeat protein
LLALLGGPGSVTRAFAARGLQTLKDPATAGALAIRAQAWQDDPRAAVASIRALAALGARETASVLRAILQARALDPTLRLETVSALGALHDTASLDRLIDLSGDGWPAMRVAALRAIRDIDPDAFMLVLSGVDQDAHWSVRAAAASILATVEPERATPRLTAMLAEKDVRVLPAAIDALARIKAADLGPRLLAFLKHDDVMVRAAAAVAIGELKVPGAEPALIEAYAAGARDGMYQARCGALTAITKYGVTAAMPVLKQALGDKDWAVRVRARTLIHELDPAVDVSLGIRPAPTRPAASYDGPAMVSPAVSPHVFIDTDKGTVEIELAVLDAPQAAANFLALAQSGHFSGVPIHRVVANFVVQDGDNRGDGEGSPGYTIRDEINERPYLRGTVGMALDWADTGGSQFFITHSPQPHLDGRYTVFGHVVAGMECVDRLQQWDVIRRVRTWDGVELTVK